MTAAYFCFTVDDVGFDECSTEPHLARLLAFCADQGLRATLFTVPRGDGREIGERREYIGLLHQAIAAGHEVAQHGLDHDRFECGIPPQMVLDIPTEGATRDRLANHRAEIDAALTVDALRQRLRTGRHILESAVGVPIRGFRAPCLSTCDNLFTAIEAEGYDWDSSRHLQQAGWDLINRRDPIVRQPINHAVFDGLQHGPLRELPLSAEYTWYLRRDQYRAALDLACSDFDACLAAGIPFIPICHVSPIQTGEGDCGFDLYRDLIAHARRCAEGAGKALVCATLSEVCAVPL